MAALAVARTLGKTLGEIAEMPHDEFQDWLALLTPEEPDPDEKMLAVFGRPRPSGSGR